MSTTASPRQWPAPLLQPDRSKDCLLYSVAYLCHCAGHLDVTAEDVRRFRREAHLWEGMLPKKRFAIAIDRYWDFVYDEPERQRYWLGPDQRVWVESHLAAGEIGLVCVERTAGRAHQLVVLESRGDAGVLVMDPLYGHRIESWQWFLSVGPSQRGCHRIDGWYRLPALLDQGM